MFKCVGHIYKIDDELVSTHFLVINKEKAVNVKRGDVIVSAQSHGFVERVARVNRSSDVVFLETELERCTGNSTWKRRFEFFFFHFTFIYFRGAGMAQWLSIRLPRRPPTDVARVRFPDSASNVG